MVALLALLGLWCFLNRSGLLPLGGLCCMLLGAAMVDRLVNSDYTFTPDGRLTLRRGRLAKPLVIPVEQIIKTTRRRGTLFVAPHIIIEYGAGHMTYAQPADPEGFIAEIERRQKNMEDTADDDM